ncbi:MAG: heme exporter protein CcmB [Gammaproteobacteria bacterium]|nr:heme exporter protein CcmB [Gammaproteobacteria bacterium]
MATLAPGVVAPAPRLFWSQFRRELVSVVRSKEEALNPLLFLFLAITLFALGAGGDPEILKAFAPAVIWVLVLLANMMSLEGLFRRDYEDGTLEQLLLLAEPGFLPVLAKIVAQWCFSGLAMTLLAPIAGLILFLPTTVLPTLMITLLLGTPALSLLGAVGAALTVGLRRGGVLLAILVLPLYIPVLIFGASAVLQHMDGVGTGAQIYWLMAISMVSITFAPFLVHAALKISVEQ